MPLEIIHANITTLRVDAIVNAANHSLLGGGGVDGAIHRAAGPELLEECRMLNGCSTGEAKITKGYRLPARYVIHTVGPVWYGGQHGEKELLSACYRNSLTLAQQHGCESVAFPLISTGVYHYPLDQGVAVAVDAIRLFLTEHEMTVYLVVYNGRTGLISEQLNSALQAHISASLSLSKKPDNKATGLPPCDTADAAEGDALPFQGEESFSRMLLRIKDSKGITDAQCRLRANVDGKLLHSICSDPSYQPSKPIALAFAISLELTFPETQDLLRRAGFSLTRSSLFDLVIEYFLSIWRFDIFEINLVLFQYGLPQLGSCANG